MEQLTHVFVLLAALSSVGTAQDLLYFTDGDERTFEVRPPVTEITSIIWKINGDLLAEWSEKFPLEIYPRFKTRTSLDTTNGSLVIRQMTKEDMGTYTVEINNMVQSANYDIKWIPRVNKPEVHVRTLTCSSDSEKCNVTCDGGTKEAEPIQYHWKIGPSEWKSPGKDIVITKEKHGGEEDITCRMKNPVSEEESEPIKNPLLQVASSVAGRNVGIVVGVLFIVAVLGSLAAMWKCNIGPFNRGTSNLKTSAEAPSAGDPFERDPLKASAGAPSAGAPSAGAPSERDPLKASAEALSAGAPSDRDPSAGDPSDRDPLKASAEALSAEAPSAGDPLKVI